MTAKSPGDDLMAPAQSQELRGIGQGNCFLDPSDHVSDPRFDFGDGQVIDASSQDDDVKVSRGWEAATVDVGEVLDAGIGDRGVDEIVDVGDHVLAPLLGGDVVADDCDSQRGLGVDGHGSWG